MRAEIPILFIVLLGACVSQLGCRLVSFGRENSPKYKGHFYRLNHPDDSEKQTTIELLYEAGSSLTGGGERVEKVPEWFGTGWRRRESEEEEAFKGYGVSIDGRFCIIHDSVGKEIELRQSRNPVNLPGPKDQGLRLWNKPKISTFYPVPDEPDDRMARDVFSVRRSLANSGFTFYDFQRPIHSLADVAKKPGLGELKEVPTLTDNTTYYGYFCYLYFYSKESRPAGPRAVVPTPLEFVRIAVEKKNCNGPICQLSITSDWQNENPTDCYGGENWARGAPVVCEEKILTYLTLPNVDSCSTTFKAYHLPQMISEVLKLREDQLERGFGWFELLRLILPF